MKKSKNKKDFVEAVIALVLSVVLLILGILIFVGVLELTIEFGSVFKTLFPYVALVFGLLGLVVSISNIVKFIKIVKEKKNEG